MGAIGAVWGIGVLIYGLSTGVQGQGGYAAGQIGAIVFGGIMGIVGLIYLIRG